MGWVLLAISVGIVGSWLGLRLAGATHVSTGPFQVRLSSDIGPGATKIELPPFGSVSANTHDSPIRLNATLEDIHIQSLKQSLEDQGLDRLVATIERDAVSAVKAYAIKAFLVAIVGAALLALAVFRTRWRLVVIAVLTGGLLVGGSELVAVATYRTSAFRAPTYSGSLALAPDMIGPLTDAGADIDYFRVELAQVVDGATRAYTTIEQNPLGRKDEIRILHISDMHLSPLGEDLALQLAEGFNVDAVLDTGDVSSFGTPMENVVLASIAKFRVPYIFVRGNHDSKKTQEAIAQIANAKVLDGTTAKVAGLSIYGLGDPTFTGEKTGPSDPQAFAEAAAVAGQQVLADVQSMLHPPDIVAVHDDRMAGSVAGLVPLVVSGHFHQQRAEVVYGTLYLRDGTTGGAGFETFLPEEGEPLSAEILHFRPATGGQPPQLIAYDVIEQFPASGDLTLTRHLVSKQFGQLTPSPADALSSPSPSGATP